MYKVRSKCQNLLQLSKDCKCPQTFIINIFSLSFITYFTFAALKVNNVSNLFRLFI